MLCCLTAGPRIKLGELIETFHLLHAFCLMRFHDVLDTPVYIEVAAGIL